MAAKGNAAVSNLPSHEVMVGRILDCYRNASPAQVEAGAQWYGMAQEWAETLAAGTAYSVTQTAGVIAALSPQTPWAINKRQAMDCVKAHAAGLPLPSCNTSAQMGKVAAILDGAMPQHALKGPKERAFFGNIMGDVSLVTVDRWAFLTATGTPVEGGGLSRAAFNIVAAAWNDAAAIFGVSRPTLQAVCWVVERGSGE